MYVGSSAYSRARYGRGRGPIHLDDVGCRGSEQRLIDCHNTLQKNCIHSEDASVRCRTSMQKYILSTKMLSTSLNTLYVCT